MFLPLDIQWGNLHEILYALQEEMLSHCAYMTAVARAVAGFGALFYIAYRVWQSLARAEPIDVFPLLRPFVVGIFIMFFPVMVIGTSNGIMKPVAGATGALLEHETFDMQQYQQQKDLLQREAMLRNPETAYLVSDEEFDRQLVELG